MDELQLCTEHNQRSPRPLRKPPVIVATNQKGGCAKTSTIFDLGGAFAQRGLRVLWVDLDPQGTLTKMLFPLGKFGGLAKEDGITALLAQMGVPLTQLLHPFHTRLENGKPGGLSAGGSLTLLPATPTLRQFNFPCGTSYDSLGNCLKLFIADVATHFDLVLVDTPPNLELLTKVGLLAADAAYTPAAPESFDVDGIWYARQLVDTAQVEGRPEWLGVVKTIVQQRTAVHLKFAQDLQEEYAKSGLPSLLFETALPLHVAFKEAAAYRTPLPLFKPTSAGAKAVVALAEEMARRVGFQLPAMPQKRRMFKGVA